MSGVSTKVVFRAGRLGVTIGRRLMLTDRGVGVSGQEGAGHETPNQRRPPELAPLEAHFTIDRYGSFDPRTGVATVTGTTTCSSGAFASVYANLAQPVGRIATINGFGFADIATCDGSPHPWSATVQPASGKFAGGHATVSANFYACYGFDCKFDSAQQDVTLRK